MGIQGLNFNSNSGNYPDFRGGRVSPVVARSVSVSCQVDILVDKLVVLTVLLLGATISIFFLPVFVPNANGADTTKQHELNSRIMAEDQALLAEEAALLEKVNLAAVHSLSPSSPGLSPASLSQGMENKVATNSDNAPILPAQAVSPSADQMVELSREVPSAGVKVAVAGGIMPPVTGVRVARFNGDVSQIPEKPSADIGVSAEGLPLNDNNGIDALPATSAPNSKVTELQERLQAAHARNLKLVEALDDARRRLMSAETEIERLSSIIEDRRGERFLSGNGSINRGSGSPGRPAFSEATASVAVRGEQRVNSYGTQRGFGSNNGAAGAVHLNTGSRIDSGSRSPVVRGAAAKTTSSVNRTGESDLTVVTVTAAKANLRTGPGLNHSPLMAVARGTRLVVERREGDWYRVVTPNGSRAWVVGSVVTFGAKESWSPSSLVQVKSFNPELEDQAFKLIQEGVGAGAEE